MIDGTRSSFSSTRNLEIVDSMNNSSSSILSYLDEEFDLNEYESVDTTHADSNQRIHTVAAGSTRRKQQDSTSSRYLKRNSHLSAIEPVFDEKKIQELLDLVGSTIQTGKNYDWQAVKNKEATLYASESVNDNYNVID